MSRRASIGIVRPAGVAPEPWANGAGTTRVLAAGPAWRISLAEIEGRMPFSPFLGADRVLIPLGPFGLGLLVDGEWRRVPPLTGTAFAGESQVAAETQGRRVAVVNLMTRRSSGRMAWSVRRWGEPSPWEDEALVVLGGRITADGESLDPGSVILPGTTRRATVRGEGIVAALRVGPSRVRGRTARGSGLPRR